jgi:hypothetical protein
MGVGVHRHLEAQNPERIGTFHGGNPGAVVGHLI